MQRLNDKVALVTGASKGIGAAIAKELAKEGASVVVNYASSRAGADRVVAEIEKLGGKAAAVQGDVAKESDVERLFAETRQVFGRLDILVNNAGIFEFLPLEQVTAEHFRRQFDVNVLGLLFASREAAKLFGPEGGSIINVSSIVSTYAPPNSAVYSGTKGAVDAITKVLANELGPRKIRVNSINPGMVETEGATAQGFMEGEFRAEVESKTPLGRIGQPEDLAPVVALLASSETSWITGESLVIAGGLR
jgi:3-oxoacyl-[acyl-carrier protein] reductase